METRKNDDVRLLVLYRLSDVKEVLLSPRNVEVIGWLMGKQKTSNELAAHLNISIYCASQLLGNLHKQGYLERFNAGDPSGGQMFKYSARKSLTPKILGGSHG